MELIPAFQIGVWNAWIFMLINFLPMPVLMFIHRGKKQTSVRAHNEAEKKLHLVSWIVWFLTVIYSVFLPLHTGTIWLYIGLPIAITGLAGYMVVMIDFATTAIENKPITKGIYRFSRHPMYITQFVTFIGVSIATASWLFLLLSITYSIFCLLFATQEERYLLEMYGDVYRDYISITPRWIGIPKSRMP